MRVICVVVFVCALAVFNGCTPQTSLRTATAPTVLSDPTSLICQALLGQFIGLPADVAGGKDDGPAAGRWWVRRCQSEVRGGQMRLRFGGPAWFWVEMQKPPFSLRNYVYFRVDAEISGSTGSRLGSRGGVVSLWFHVARASASVEPLGRIHPRADTAAAWVFRVVSAPIPSLNVDARARQQLRTQATRRFEAALRRGFTLVYDISRGQPDFGLGLLPAGITPAHPFSNERSWFTNERLLAAPGGVHVLGPFKADAPLALDARILSGAGLAWRSICASDLERVLAPVERGEPPKFPKQGSVSAGVLSGLGLHEARLSAQHCPFYVLVSPVGQNVSHAAIRVRHS